MELIDIFTISFTIIIGCFLLKKCYSNSNGTFLNVYYIAFYLIQLIIACIILLLDFDFCLWNGYTIFLRSAITPFSISILIAIIGVYCGARLANHIFHRKYNISLDTQLMSIVSRYNTHQVSLFFLVLFLFTILTSLNISYIVAVFALTFSFIPIFIGFLWKKLNKTDKILWVIVLTINMIFHILQGSRGTALFPIFFAIFGYVISIKNNTKLLKRKLIIFSIIGVLLMPTLSIVSAFREVYGRGLEVSFDSLFMMIDYVQSESTVVDEDNGLNQSLGRMLIQANVATPFLTPSPIPYRGWKSFNDEIFSIVSLKGESGRDQYRLERSDLGYGTGVATQYGFHVNEFTSVEWPIIADSFSRFGCAGLFIYSFAFALFLSYIEIKCKNLWKKNALLSLVLHLFILYNGALSYMFSYYAFMKLLLFRLPLVIIIMWIFSKIVKRTNDSYI